MKTHACVAYCSLALALAACAGSTYKGTPYLLKADREIEAYLPGDVKKVHTAAERVLKEKFRYAITRAGVDAREGIIEAKTSTGETVRVETYRSTPTATRTEIFVGPLGNVEAMQDLLEEISAGLK
jgi:predicted TIM-barrel enzyme